MKYISLFVLLLVYKALVQQKNLTMKTIITFLSSLLILCCNTTTTAQVIQQDSLALVAFYNSTGGPNWNNNSNWLIGPVSTWYGVTVEGGRVTELDIDHNNLQGNIPSDIGNLTNLKMLLIGHEDGLIGSIPTEIGNLQLLIGLGIGNCSLTGTIPNTIGNCSCLEFVNLWENNLTGHIPPGIGNLDSLKFLDLHENLLTGSIPSELGNLNDLWELRLNNNQLLGTIPEDVSLLDQLKVLDVSNNQLSGELPEYLSNLFYQSFPSYISLDISHNNFSGPVPESWGNQSFLIDALNLSFNHFTSLPPVDYNWNITFFNIKENKLTFEHIESHYQSYQQSLYWYFYYYPQDDMMEEIDTVLAPGSNYSIYSGTEGEYTNYKWFKDGELILESPDADSLFFVNVSTADIGTYTCQADNSLIYNLILNRKPVHITINTGIQINHNNLNQLRIYPNPAKDNITVLLPFKSVDANLLIYNLNGKCVFKQEQILINNSKITAGIKGLKPGIYLLRIQTENRNYSTKLIISKQGTNR